MFWGARPSRAQFDASRGKHEGDGAWKSVRRGTHRTAAGTAALLNHREHIALFDSPERQRRESGEMNELVEFCVRVNNYLMKQKIILCLALILSGSLILSRAADSNTITSTNLSVAKIVNPQGSVNLPKLGQAIFREQSSSFSLQVPIGNRKNGEPMSNSINLDLQVWLLKTNGTSILQLGSPSEISIGSIGDYSTDYMFYQFSKVPVDELSGVVVSVSGKLYCHEIEKSQGKP
jgi:hypothetical protein